MELCYDFVSPPRIVFGWGRRREVGGLARSLGQRAFIVHGSRTLERAGHLAELSDQLRQAGVEPIELTRISREPLVEDVDRAAQHLRVGLRAETDLIVAIGGGAAIDLGKALAAMATNTEGDSVRDYLEGVGRGLALTARPLPVLAMPTTAGTGSEATKNAVISNHEPAFKKSLRSLQMVPRIALVDPELGVTAPPEVTAASGMDTVTQLIESYLSRKAQPIPQALCVQGLRLAFPAVREAVHDGTSRSAREAMSHAALLSGLALANSGLGMAHGVAAALGVHCNIPHGLACAVMLPVTLQTNRAPCSAEMADLARLCGIEAATTDAAIEDFIMQIRDINAEIGIPARLSELGVRRDQVSAIVAGSRGNSMSGNPVDVSDEQLSSILEGML